MSSTNPTAKPIGSRKGFTMNLPPYLTRPNPTMPTTSTTKNEMSASAKRKDEVGGGRPQERLAVVFDRADARHEVDHVAHEEKEEDGHEGAERISAPCPCFRASPPHSCTHS